MMRLEGSCRCGAIAFAVMSHAPVPYQRCYCSICRKTAGSGGYAINLSAVADTLAVKDRGPVGMFRAIIDGEQGTAERSFCTRCGTPLWVYDPTWPELLHPFAAAIDTALPEAPATTHLLLADKPDWVQVELGPNDLTFEGFPEESIEDWHRRQTDAPTATEQRRTSPYPLTKRSSISCVEPSWLARPRESAAARDHATGPRTRNVSPPRKFRKPNCRPSS